MVLHHSTLFLAGVLLLSLVTVESGGLFLQRAVQGDVPANDLQRSFFRAGHAHAGVLLILSLLVPLYLDAAGVTGLIGVAGRYAIPAAAIVLPAGFFLAGIGRDPKRPNRFVVLLPVGAALLAIGLLCAGISVLTV